ncbi:unnamed protein product [Closterium sp. Naga37s-1]|nr:unnamed protein product [Closterium sp. Naga37s-1]
MPIRALTVCAMPIRALTVCAMPIRALTVCAMPIRALTVCAMPIRALTVCAMPIRALTVCAMPIRALTVRAMPIRALTVCAMPIRALTVCAMPIRALTVCAMPIRALTAAQISHLVKISGIVIASSRAKAKATSVVLMCRSCKNVKAIPCRPGLGGAIIPRTCDRTPQPGEEPCGVDPWVVLPDRSEYVDQQTLKLQENPEVTEENPEVTEENPEVTEESPEVTEENPEVTQENPGVTQENPEVTEENFEVTEENPEVTQENPEVTQENPEVTQENPEVTEENPEVTQENPEVTQENPEVTQEYPGVTQEDPEENPEVTEGNSEVTEENPEVTEENPEVSEENPEGTEENPERPAGGGPLVAGAAQHDVPTGEMPRSVLLAVDRSLVQRISPGTRITVFGIFSIFQASDKTKSRGAMAVAIRQPYLRVVGVEMAADGAARSTASSFTTDEEAEFKEFSRQGDVYGAISSQIAPSIFGHADIKKAIACLLFGGARKLLPDGARLRGDINVLLIGDPSTAKSQFLKFVEKTAPIAVYTSGKGSSAAGLTASVIRDASSREFYLEGGAMVLADGGVVCIDEFDKMRPEDSGEAMEQQAMSIATVAITTRAPPVFPVTTVLARSSRSHHGVAIHEAMEQQTISIAKAGITTVLNSRTSVLAAANPPSGRYDDLRTAQENIDLQSTILSRFDLIFVVKDTRDFNRDLQIARHVVNVHAKADAVLGQADDAMGGRAAMGDGPAGAGGVGHAGKDGEQENWLKRYIEFARTRCSPRLSESAATLLQNNYVQIRQNMRRRATETGEASALPITVRQLEAIVRLSESMARMQLSPVATEEHVTEALRLFHVATLDAARSGVVDGAVLTEEQRREVQQVEGAVRRRVAIGGFVSERRLLDDITRSGISESAVSPGMRGVNQRLLLDERSQSGFSESGLRRGGGHGRGRMRVSPACLLVSFALQPAPLLAASPASCLPC